MEFLKLCKKQSVQSCFACGNGDYSRFEIHFICQLKLCSFKLILYRRNVKKQPFSLRCKRGSAVRPDKESAAEFMFKIVNAACDIRLAAAENFCSLCKTAVFCDKIKYAVIIVWYGRFAPPIYIKMIWYIYKVYFLHISSTSIYCCRNAR